MCAVSKSDQIERKCNFCGLKFSTHAGSLVRNCRRPECVEMRRAKNGEIHRAEEQSKQRLLALRRDPNLRSIWPEVEACLEELIELGAPDGPEPLTEAVRRVSRAAGALDKRDALIDLAAIALRWAGCLPRTEKRGRPAKVAA